MAASSVLSTLAAGWLAGPGPALALPRAAPSGVSGLVLAQATPQEPSSVDELRAAIESIKAKLARQRAAQPQNAPAPDLAAQLRSAGERTAELTRQLEGLRTERDGLREELVKARDEATQLEAEAAGARQQAEQAQASVDARIASLEQRLKDVDQAREGALARAASLETELNQERTSRAAGDEALERSRQELAELTRARDEATKALSARDADLSRLSSSVAQLQQDLADREGKLQAATEETAVLRKTVDEATAARAQLEAQIVQVRAEADAKSEERARAMTADVEAAQQRARKLDDEIAQLREIASSSVQEVQSIGEQLLTALKQNQELTAALTDQRATRELLEVQLAASRRELQAANETVDALRTAPARAAEAGEEPEGAGGELALVRLNANDDAAPGAGPSGAAAAALLSDVSLTDAGDGWMMTVPEDLEFAPGSETIREGTTASLGKVAELIKAYGTPAVRIVGHTDAEGDASFNRRLSQRRAQAVREYLIAQFQIEPRLVTTEGYGETRPIASNQTNAGRRLNRRVEVYVKP
jgi:outer membrane protein OmpA-like peptidoglycan-associated protein